MRSIAALTVVAIVAAAAVIHELPDGEAHADPRPARTREVHSVSIDGEPGLPMAALREALETRIGRDADTRTLERDRQALARVLADRGYLAAEVAPPVVTYGASGGAYVVFDVDRGPLYHVRDVALEGASWSDAGVMPLATGDEASLERLERVRLAAEATLARHGKALQVELALDADHADAMVDVRYTTR